MDQSNLQTNNKQSGYTLAEMTIIVGIIAIVAIFLLIGLDPIKQFFKGYDTVRKSDLAKLKTAFENYYNDKECYPDGSVLSMCGSNILQPYLDKIPCNPGTQEPYEVYMLPADSTCAQKFAIYASLSSGNDNQSDMIKYCPKTIAAASADMNYTDIIKGCSGQELCQTIYGCRNGACVIVALDSVPSCSPNSCDPNCGVDCSRKNRRGQYTNECREI